MSASEFILVVIVVVLVAVCGGLLSVLRRQAAARSGLEAVPEDVLGLRQEVAALRAEAAGALRHLSVVRYDAFGDMGGHLSWSLALADDGGDGVVLTSIHGRSDARTYAKTISGWSSDQQLSPRRRKRSPTHVRERAAACSRTAAAGGGGALATTWMAAVAVRYSWSEACGLDPVRPRLGYLHRLHRERRRVVPGVEDEVAGRVVRQELAPP